MNATSPVNSYNEWDPLEEVIVGRLENAMFPEFDLINQYTFPQEELEFIKAEWTAGTPYPKDAIIAGQQDLDAFIHILQSEGVIVRQPDIVDYAKSFSTPSWRSISGFCAANPRDPFLIIGDEIIETPMADRSRYFECFAYRSLFKEYFEKGARWVSAPKPQLTDQLYRSNFKLSQYGDKTIRFVVTEFEPTFDAADFIRCGRDIFCQKSHVTNAMGIEWLRRYLGEGYRIHEIKSKSPTAMHIDTTLMPLAPGKVLANPQWTDLDDVRQLFKGWDVLVVPPPVKGNYRSASIISSWVNMNVLMLDHSRVIVEKKQTPMIDFLKKNGFDPIPCPFENYYDFFGSFHCATLDIRRKGTCESYF